jgi:hypothetical protein
MSDFQKDPRSFALDLVEQGMISADDLLLAALNWMSTDDVRGMLDANEMSPRFFEDEDGEWEGDEYDGQPDEAQEWYDFDPEC